MTSEIAGAAGSGRSRLAIAAWCLYDWANSAFPAVITTFVFATYFTEAVAPDPITGTSLWGQAVAVAGVILAITSPILGAAADAGGRRMPWLGAFTVLAVVSIALLWLVEPQPSWVGFALITFVIATIAFEMATVFYNALLPELAPPDHIGRVSGWGWGLGYVGGIACLSILLLVFIQVAEPPFGLDRGKMEQVRIAGPFAAIWYALFCLPLFLLVREGPKQLTLIAALRQGGSDVVRTLRDIGRYRTIGWFLLAHMIYADGLNTLFAFGAIYAAGTFKMDTSEVILFGVALNLTAGAGAFGFAWIDDRIGPRRTIAYALVGLIVLGAALLLIDTKTQFWALGLAIGCFFGPVQAASRSFVARVAPPEACTEMFGLLALSGKATAFVGPAVLALVTSWLGSQRAGMATILFFLLAGLLVLLLKVPAGSDRGPATAT